MRAVASFEAGQDVLRVGLDSFRAEAEARGRHGGGVSIGKQLQDLSLTGSDARASGSAGARSRIGVGGPRGRSVDGQADLRGLGALCNEAERARLVRLA